GQHFQLREGSVSLESATVRAISRDRQFRQTDAADGDTVRGAPGGAGTQHRGVEASQEADDADSSRVRAQGAASSVAVLHGGRTRAKIAFWLCAHPHDLSRTPAPTRLGWTGNGRYSHAA